MLSRQCLDRRIPDQAILEAEVSAWVEERNHQAVGIDWRFSVQAARSTLSHLYPVPETVT